MYGSALQTMAALRRDPTLASQRIKPGTVRRISAYARPFRGRLTVLLTLTALDAAAWAGTPLLLKVLIDDGILRGDDRVVLLIAGAVGGIALLDALIGIGQAWLSAQIGENLVFDLRNQVFQHVQRQSIAFFTRAQTGALVSRLNTDIVGAQQALTSILTSVLSSVISLILVLATMAYLSWLVTLVALVLIPFFIIPAKLIGRRLQRLTRQSMQLNAEMGAVMTERFNVAGAMLSRLYGQPALEARTFSERAGRVRDVGTVATVYGRLLFVALTLLSSLAAAVVFGLGGSMVVHGKFQLGTLIALTSLLNRLYGPITSLSSVQVSVMTALVSFDRVFDVLDLQPLVAELPNAMPLGSPPPRRCEPVAPPALEFDDVSFRYPLASEVSLASLESIARLPAEQDAENSIVLTGISFRVPSGTMTALVGPSGGGKTTISYLAVRLYDPLSGSVRMGGVDVRQLTFASLNQTVGVVTQDPHLFHDTIRANLSYANPAATEEDLIHACEQARIWDLVSSLPAGLDTTVGERGYRLSGGERQRLALARLMLKGPSVVVLDEATAHLDYESEAAVQQALGVVLGDCTSLVIAHRLSTVRNADQILVIDAGQIVARGTHPELLTMGGLYAHLYRTQFQQQRTAADNWVGYSTK